MTFEKIYNLAKELGCNKVALAHHRDDAIETLLMSMFFEVAKIGLILVRFSRHLQFCRFSKDINMWLWLSWQRRLSFGESKW